MVLPIIEANNLELVDVEYVKEGSDYYLRIYADKEGGITIGDCEIVNRAMSDLLDADDFIKDAYILEVSSPGLTRPLKKENDFKRSIGKIVEIKTSDLNADIVITERKFDTDKDVDPATGERPVSSQTDTHIVIGRRDSTVTADSLGIDKTITGIEDIDKKTDIEHKDVDDKKESRWPIAITSISVLLILLVLIYLLKKMKVL